MTDDAQPIFDAILECDGTRITSVDEAVTWVKSTVAELGQAQNATDAVDEDREAAQTERDEAFELLRTQGYEECHCASGTVFNDGYGILAAIRLQHRRRI